MFPKAANRGASHQTPTLPLQNLGTSEPKGPSPPLTTPPPRFSQLLAYNPAPSQGSRTARVWPLQTSAFQNLLHSFLPKGLCVGCFPSGELVPRRCYDCLFLLVRTLSD